MFKATDFVYDGVASSAYNLKLLRINETDGYTTGTGVPKKSFVMVKNNRSAEKQIVGFSIDDTQTFKVQILVDRDEGNPTPIPRNQVKPIRNWLFNKTNFKKMYFLQPDLRDYYYMVVFTDVEDLYLEGEIIGFEATLVTNNTGMYKTKRVSKKCTGYTTFSIINDTSSLFPTYPKIKMTMHTAYLNLNINGRETSFINIIPESEITIDSKSLIIEAGLNELFDGNFNLVYPELKPGKNTIIVTGDVDITFELDEIEEVGV